MSDNTNSPNKIWAYFFSIEDGLVCKQLAAGSNLFGVRVTYDENRKLILPTNEFSISYDRCWSNEKDIDKALLAFKEAHQRVWKDLTKRANHEVAMIRKIDSEIIDLHDLGDLEIWRT